MEADRKRQVAAEIEAGKRIARAIANKKAAALAAVHEAQRKAQKAEAAEQAAAESAAAAARKVADRLAAEEAARMSAAEAEAADPSLLPRIESVNLFPELNPGGGGGGGGGTLVQGWAAKANARGGGSGGGAAANTGSGGAASRTAPLSTLSTSSSASASNGGSSSGSSRTAMMPPLTKKKPAPKKAAKRAPPDPKTPMCKWELGSFAAEGCWAHRQGKCNAMHNDQLAALQLIADQMPAPKPISLVLDPALLTIEDAVLGAGSFATVRSAKYTFPVHGETDVAVKIFRGTEALGGGANSVGGLSAMGLQALTELNLGEQVSRNNPFLVQTYGGIQKANAGVCLVMERMAGRCLRAVLDAEDATPLRWGLRARWLFEIAAGMRSMHSHRPCPVVHRDLKASNVLLDSLNLEDARAKIADFGVAKAMDAIVTDTYSRGAREWSAPETLAGKFKAPCFHQLHNTMLKLHRLYASLVGILHHRVTATISLRRTA